MKFRKKPVVVEASQWFQNGDHPLDYTRDYTEDGQVWTAEYRKENGWEGEVVRYYRSPNMDGGDECKICKNLIDEHGWIDTLEGGHIVCPGDWIITGVQGERYPCKSEIFHMTYEIAEEQ